MGVAVVPWAELAASGMSIDRRVIDMPRPDGAGRVAVHLAVASGLPPDAASLVRLEANDEARLARLRRADDRRRFVAGRALAAALTREVCGADVEQWRLRAPERRGTAKPRWVSVVGAEARRAAGAPSVSITHAGSVVVVALSTVFEVGVDVESVAAISEAGLEGLAGVLRPTEAARLLGVRDAGQQARELAAVFTAKEAVLKAVGWGLAVDPRALHVEGERVLAFDAEQACSATLRRLELPVELDADFVAHVALADVELGA